MAYPISEQKKEYFIPLPIPSPVIHSIAINMTGLTPPNHPKSKEKEIPCAPVNSRFPILLLFADRDSEIEHIYERAQATFKSQSAGKKAKKNKNRMVSSGSRENNKRGGPKTYGIGR